MKIVASFALLSATLVAGLVAQRDSKPNAIHVGDYRISPAVAEKLLFSKAALRCPKKPMPPRIIGTVVIAFVLDKNGNVADPKVVSGPAFLRTPVLDAVRKYKYNPYLLNGEAIEVGTSVSVAVDTYQDCPNYR